GDVQRSFAVYSASAPTGGGHIAIEFAANDVERAVVANGAAVAGVPGRIANGDVGERERHARVDEEQARGAAAAEGHGATAIGAVKGSGRGDDELAGQGDDPASGAVEAHRSATRQSVPQSVFITGRDHACG